MINDQLPENIGISGGEFIGSKSIALVDRLVKALSVRNKTVFTSLIPGVEQSVSLSQECDTRINNVNIVVPYSECIRDKSLLDNFNVLPSSETVEDRYICSVKELHPYYDLLDDTGLRIANMQYGLIDYLRYDGLLIYIPTIDQRLGVLNNFSEHLAAVYKIPVLNLASREHRHKLNYLLGGLLYG